MMRRAICIVEEEHYDGCKGKDEASTGEMDSDRDKALVEYDLPESLFRM